MLKRFSNSAVTVTDEKTITAVTVTDEKTITKTMIPVYPYSTGHWFKHTVYEKDFEASKK